MIKKTHKTITFTIIKNNNEANIFVRQQLTQNRTKLNFV